MNAKLRKYLGSIVNVIIVVPQGVRYSEDAIKKLTELQEKYFTSKIIRS